MKEKQENSLEFLGKQNMSAKVSDTVLKRLQRSVWKFMAKYRKNKKIKITSFFEPDCLQERFLQSGKDRTRKEGLHRRVDIRRCHLLGQADFVRVNVTHFAASIGESEKKLFVRDNLIELVRKIWCITCATLKSSVL